MGLKPLLRFFPDMIPGQPFIHPHRMPNVRPVPRREPLRRQMPKVPRNAPCPCGSGKKFKHCCLRKGGPGGPRAS